MVDLQLRLSKPCGIAKQNYNRRQEMINRLYENPSNCDYEAPDGGSREHPLYFETGFFDDEFDVYSQNFLIGRIKERIPTWIYSDFDLKLNDYNMYYKPYSTLKMSCQASY